MASQTTIDRANKMKVMPKRRAPKPKRRPTTQTFSDGVVHDVDENGVHRRRLNPMRGKK